ncbi:MAG: NPCBM/NEW2 domain-containing protein, partial [Bacteroidota bacterium]
MNKLRILSILCLALALLSGCQQSNHHTVWMDDLPVALMEYGKRKVRPKGPGHHKDVHIGDSIFQRGVGVQPINSMLMDLNGKAIRFEAHVGKGQKGKDEFAFTFHLIGDQKLLWKSQNLKKGDPAEFVQVDLQGVQQLGLLMMDNKNNWSWDYGYWADAQFVMQEGYRPELVNWKDQKQILTPPPSPKPRINNPDVFGLRPENPLVFSIAASGDRPMEFAAENLPSGLRIDPQNGRLEGSVPQKGNYKITLIARNQLGEDRKELELIVGPQLALTPPMGWNGWNSWAADIDEQKVRASARAMVDKGLQQYGWSYINIDDDWQGRRGGPYNAIQANEKFPDMPGLIDSIHQLGLKAGIYSSPWVMTYAARIGGSSDRKDGAWNFPKDYRKHYKDYRYVGQYTFDQEDVAQWVDWGIDYLKYDWKIALPSTIRMNEVLKTCGRDIIFTLSNTAKIDLASELSQHSNSWRTSGDIRDTWQSIYTIGFAQNNWHPYSAPGHWNDPDMLVIGDLTCGKDSLHASRLSPDEQYSHISLWSLLAAPLLIGCPLERLDEFSLNLLTNTEVIAINQDRLGRQAQMIHKAEDHQIWAKPLKDESWAVGLFYTGQYGKELKDYFTWKDSPSKKIKLDWSMLKINGKYQLRDVWRQKDLGIFDQAFIETVPFHGVLYLTLSNRNK